MLLFNKERRMLGKLFDNLFDKIKTSKSIKVEYKGNAEVCSLDSIDISFDTVTSKIVVTDKSGAEIYTMDCHHPQMPLLNTADELQQYLANGFHAMLMHARKVYDKKQEKSKKMKEDLDAARANLKAKSEQKQAEQIRQSAMMSALDKLKSL